MEPRFSLGDLGRYVYVVDTRGVIHVAPDQLHMHPKVLGSVESALYAGEIGINLAGIVYELTNCSGTFQFKSKRSLCCVATHLVQLGFAVRNIIWFPPDGNSPPLRLQCI